MVEMLINQSCDWLTRFMKVILLGLSLVKKRAMGLSGVRKGDLEFFIQCVTLQHNDQIYFQIRNCITN